MSENATSSTCGASGDSRNPSGANQQQQSLHQHYGPPSSASKSTRQVSKVTQQSCQFDIANFATPAFQQVKQTQASLTRLSRGHQMQLQQQQLQIAANQSSHQQTQHLKRENSQPTAQDSGHQHQEQQQVAKSSPSFVDCLIRRFRDAFKEPDSCQVPVFVVGNLSPGSDGTHLILPPCVSLSCQNINRFASQKNFRLINSIRESCLSIEELDLGGNKISDLIELYKILQCMPNLKFLNLSENDLSRTAPVALANSSSSGASSSSSPSSSPPSNSWVSAGLSSHQHSVVGIGTQPSRNYLAPLQQNGSCSSLSHRTLSNVDNPRNSQQRHSRLVEARRLAATAAVAHTKKTPTSSMVSKLANSTAVSGSLSRLPAGSGCSSNHQAGKTSNDQAHTTGANRHRTATSTMSLARSMSSLSAKDAKATLSRLSSHHCHRSSVRSKEKSATAQRATNNSNHSTGPNETPAKLTRRRDANHQTGLTPKVQNSQSQQQQNPACKSPTRQAGPHSAPSPNIRLYSEPITELEGDVEMSGDPQQQQQQNQSHLSKPVGIQSRPQPATSHEHRGFNLTGASGTGSSQGHHFPFRRTFESIKALALNNTSCQWRVVCSILSRMPNLEELHLSLNNYERIDLDIQEFRHYSLKRLYLCNNPKLTNWQELDKLLIAFPSLEALSIADCNISQIPENLGSSREWRRICGLNINGWPIKEWPIIERLNELPSLIDLKCRNLELLSNVDAPRNHLIARLPRLQRLNGSEIEERDHAEKAFLAFFVTNSHLERPSRFHELLQIHGEVAPIIDAGEVDLSPPSHASVRVIFFDRNYYCKQNKIQDQDVYMSEDFLSKLTDVVQSDPSQEQAIEETALTTICNTRDPIVRLFKDESQEVVSMNVDLRQSVRKFKQTLANLFCLKSGQNLILYYIDHEMVGLMGPELIKHNQKKLWNYNVQDGDQFIVEEV